MLRYTLGRDMSVGKLGHSDNKRGDMIGMQE